MKSFETSRIDLDIEIKGFDGKVNKITCRYNPVTAGCIKKILANWQALEENLPEDNRAESRIDLVARELAAVYAGNGGGNYEWWQEHVSFDTQVEILQWISGELQGNKKK